MNINKAEIEGRPRIVLLNVDHQFGFEGKKKLNNHMGFIIDDTIKCQFYNPGNTRTHQTAPRANDCPYLPGI
jgi:hypothetical protein